MSDCCTGSLVVLEMESSGKWPNQVTAINHIKTALYINMARNLRQQCGLIAAPTADYLDVLKVCLSLCVWVIVQNDMFKQSLDFYRKGMFFG